MKIKAKRRGGSRLRKQLRRLSTDLRQPIRDTMEWAGKELEAEIAARAPKDTGQMAEAAMYRVSNDGLGVSVGYGQKAGFKRVWRRGGFKALWIEFGTKDQLPQPFLRPAYRAKLVDILKRIRGAVRATVHNLKGV